MSDSVRGSRAALRGLAEQLRCKGWRVRNGGWPDTLAEEAMYDFCVTKNFIFPMHEDAGAAIRQLIGGQDT